MGDVFMRICVLNLKFTASLLKACLIITLVFITVFSSARALIGAAADVAASGESKNGRVIVIDAGHGGEDPGAIGVSGVYEKDLCLTIALMLGDELTKQGYTVVYTRTEDKMLYLPEENIKGFRKLSDLKGRLKVANGIDNALLVSIHMNSFGDAKYSGLQAYYKPNDKSSEALAEAVQSAVKTQLQGENNRAIKSGKDIYLLENASCESVLIECGFITNAAECEKLSQKEYQKQLSFSIACGIIEYIMKTT